MAFGLTLVDNFVRYFGDIARGASSASVASKAAAFSDLVNNNQFIAEATNQYLSSSMTFDAWLGNLRNSPEWDSLDEAAKTLLQDNSFRTFQIQTADTFRFERAFNEVIQAANATGKDLTKDDFIQLVHGNRGLDRRALDAALQATYDNRIDKSIPRFDADEIIAKADNYTPSPKVTPVNRPASEDLRLIRGVNDPSFWGNTPSPSDPRYGEWLMGRDRMASISDGSSPPSPEARFGSGTSDEVNNQPQNTINYGPDRPLSRRLGFVRDIGRNLWERLEPTRLARMDVGVRRWHFWSRYQSISTLGVMAKAANYISNVFGDASKGTDVLLRELDREIVKPLSDNFEAYTDLLKAQQREYPNILNMLRSKDPQQIAEAKNKLILFRTELDESAAALERNLMDLHAGGIKIEDGIADFKDAKDEVYELFKARALSERYSDRFKQFVNETNGEFNDDILAKIKELETANQQLDEAAKAIAGDSEAYADRVKVLGIRNSYEDDLKAMREALSSGNREEFQTVFSSFYSKLQDPDSLSKIEDFEALGPAFVNRLRAAGTHVYAAVSEVTVVTTAVKRQVELIIGKIDVQSKEEATKLLRTLENDVLARPENRALLGENADEIDNLVVNLKNAISVDGSRWTVDAKKAANELSDAAEKINKADIDSTNWLAETSEAFDQLDAAMTDMRSTIFETSTNQGISNDLNSVFALLDRVDLNSNLADNADLDAAISLMTDVPGNSAKELSELNAKVPGAVNNFRQSVENSFGNENSFGFVKAHDDIM